MHACYKKKGVSVSRKSQAYIAVAGYQKLEHSITFHPKTQTVIGNAKHNQFIAQCDLIYHEMADIHLDKEYTDCADGEGEAFVITNH